MFPKMNERFLPFAFREDVEPVGRTGNPGKLSKREQVERTVKITFFPSSSFGNGRYLSLLPGVHADDLAGFTEVKPFQEKSVRGDVGH